MVEKKQAGYNKKMQKQETRECRECSYHKKCGGCEYSGIPYEEQLQKKEKRVARLLREFGKVEPIVGMSYPYYYRNKVHAVYAQKKNGQVICGTYEKDSHRVVDIESCLLEDKQSTAIIRDIRGLLRSFKIKPYNEDTGYGPVSYTHLIHFEALEQMLTSDVMAVLINTPNNPSGVVYSEKTIEQLAELLRAKEKEFGHEIFLISEMCIRDSTDTDHRR